MRSLIKFAFAGILASLSGCNEFVSNNEPVTAIDVVGDPSDPASDPMEPADILGSAMPAADDSESLTVRQPESAPSTQAAEDDTAPSSPLVSSPTTKPVSLKKSTN